MIIFRFFKNFLQKYVLLKLIINEKLITNKINFLNYF